MVSHTVFPFIIFKYISNYTHRLEIPMGKRTQGFTMSLVSKIIEWLVN